MLHKNALIGDLHYIQNWEVADETARLALELTALDEGKVARQLDNGIFYILTDFSGPSWTAMALSSAGTVTLLSAVNGSGLTITITDPSTTPEIEIELTDSTNESLAAGLEVGYRSIPQNSKSAAYTLLASDNGKHILHPAADTNNRTFTIPANSSVPFPIGAAITFVNESPNDVTIAITTDTLVLAGEGTTGSRTLVENGIATALKITSTKWIISGSGLE